MTPLRRINRPLADCVAFARGLWALTVAQLGIAFERVPVSATLLGLSFTEPTPSGRAPSGSDLARAARVARRLASALGARNYCLRHSLILGHLLRAHGPALRIGVRRAAGSIEAHAYIEIGGAAIERRTTTATPDFVTLRRAP